jgi:hypothetical protein
MTVLISIFRGCGHHFNEQKFAFFRLPKGARIGIILFHPLF